MSHMKAYTILCDARDCQADAGFEASLREAREAAHSEGWTSVTRNHARLDYCPEHGPHPEPADSESTP